MPFSAASFRTAGVARTSERSGRSAVAVEEAETDGCGDEDDIEGGGGEGRRAGCDGTDSDEEGAEGVGDDGS